MREEVMRGTENTAERLRKLRQQDRRGFKSAAAAARAMGINVTTYQGHENNSRGLTRETLQKYARFYGVTLEYLLSARGSSKSSQVPVVGFIGPGQEFTPVDRDKRGQYLEFVDPPSGVDGDLVCARIRGDSMFPFMDGWLIFWAKDDPGSPRDVLGQLCVVTLKDDRVFFKFLHPGSARGLYNLASSNAPLILDVEVESAVPVLDIRPVY